MTTLHCSQVKLLLWPRSWQRVRGDHQPSKAGGLQPLPVQQGSRIALTSHGFELNHPSPVAHANLRQPLLAGWHQGSVRATKPQGALQRSLEQGQKTSDWMDRVVTSPCPAPQLAVDLPLPSVPVGGPLSLFLDSWRSTTRSSTFCTFSNMEFISVSTLSHY